MIAAFLWMPLMLVMEVQTPSDGHDTPDWLVGNWSGQGLLFGEPARMRLSVCPLVGHRGLTLDYQVEGESNPAMRFSGHADYLPDSGNRWRGRWIGSNNVDHDLTAITSDQAFLATWHNAAVETGQTQYRLIAPGHLKVTDYVQRDGGGLESFASADYRHKTACPSLPDDGDQ